MAHLATTTEGLSNRSVSGGRRFRNSLAGTLIIASVLVAMVPLALLLYFVVKKGASLISLSFLTQPLPLPRFTGPGMGPAVVGTIVVTLSAAVLAIPLGILAAVYVVEYGAANKVSSVIRFLSDVMAGVPSIVMGLFIYTIFTLHFGLSGTGGALALACLMLPIVIRSTDNMLRLVPSDLREASFALGTNRSRTILTVVLPAALGGITSGALLAVARAAGETAPLLFTIGTISPGNAANWNVFRGSNTTLSAQIFSLAQFSFTASQDRAFGAALTLIGLVMILTIVARVVTSRLQIKPD